jgi:hypothetical protein
MSTQRRNFLIAVLPAGLAAVGFSRFAEAFSFNVGQQQGQPPNRFPQGPPDNNGPELPPGVNSKDMLKHNQKEIEQDVQKLYSLAGELKEQVEKTDSASVLSLPLVQKAEAIEKLAKQIKNLAKG